MLPVGSPETKDDFIDREKEISQILSALKKDSVLLIADLENDFYIENDPPKGLTFYSRMLRDWWRLYHGEIK